MAGLKSPCFQAEHLLPYIPSLPNYTWGHFRWKRWPEWYSFQCLSVSLFVSALKPDVIILEIGTNDLAANRPEVVGSEIDDLVQLLLQSYSVRVIGVCEVIPRVRAPFFNAAAPILNQYLTDVLQLCPNVFSWRHTGFSNPTVSPYLPDGVHLNPQGQYSLYRSYRGAILKALCSLWFSHLDAFLFWHCFIRPWCWILLILIFSPCCNKFFVILSPCCSGLF